MPNEFQAIVRNAELLGTTLREQELEMLGISHESIGAYALGIWGFSDAVVEAVAKQESPDSSVVEDRNHPLFWLHIARAHCGGGAYVDPLQIDSEWVDRLGITDQEISQLRSAA